MNYGFVRVGAAVPALRVANCQYNANEIINIINKADESDVQILVFPELSITGYTCGDLFYQGTLIREVEIQLSRILENTLRSDIVIIIGAPVFSGNQLFSCGVVIQKGKILGAVPKTHVMTQGSLSSGRWFTSGLTVINEEINLCNQNVPFGTDLLFRTQEKNNASFGIEISQDMWNPLPPSSFQAASGAVILFNLSAEGELAGRHIHRKELIRQQSDSYQ